jgi:dodecin
MDTVARVTEISPTSTTSSGDAIAVGIEREHRTLRNLRSAWIKDQRVDIEDGAIAKHKVNLLVTFVLED